jgi:orotidine-5'-phosphate decarboxylase
VDGWNTEETGVGLASLGSTGGGSTSMGSTGVVLGATVNLREFSIDVADLRSTPILAPGFGHQGAQFADIRSTYREASNNVVVAASRSILAAGPDRIVAAIDEQAAAVAAVFSR